MLLLRPWFTFTFTFTFTPAPLLTSPSPSLPHPILHTIHKLTPLPPQQSETFSNFGTSLKGSATRLGRMAQSGNKVAVLKLAGILVGVVLVLYWIWHLLF
jgi:hypothetical protein